MYSALSIQKSLRILDRKNSFMPNIRMDIQASTTVTPDCDHVFQFKIVARRCDWHDKRLFVQWKKKLPAVRMVVHVPNQYLFAWYGRCCRLSQLLITAPTEYIVAVHSLVAPHQNIAIPITVKNTFHIARLIPGSDINWPPSMRRPLYDFDLKTSRVINQVTKLLY